MKWYLIRHAQAEQSAASDEVRTLTDHGREQATLIAHGMAQSGVQLTHLYCSPRVRAQQTAQIIGERLGLVPEITSACDFDFTAEKALALCANLPDNAQVAFVGHNPSMSMTVAQLSGAMVDLSTAAVAYVKQDSFVKPLHGVLKWLLTPRIVQAMRDGA